LEAYEKSLSTRLTIKPRHLESESVPVPFLKAGNFSFFRMEYLPNFNKLFTFPPSNTQAVNQVATDGVQLTAISGGRLARLFVFQSFLPSQPINTNEN
jgi:hypothetical protein